MGLIKNRGFNLPAGPDGSTPQGWAVTKNWPVAGTSTWQVGVWRAMKGGPLPAHGDRCLMFGIQEDSFAQTDSWGSSDGVSIRQTFGSGSFKNVQEVLFDYVAADQGSDPGGTRIKLLVYDTETEADDSLVLDEMNVGEKATFRVDVTTLDVNKEWFIDLELGRTRILAEATLTYPRVYVDNMRVTWRPYKERYSQ